MESDRVADVKVVLDGVIDDLGDAVDADRCAVTGMSFGGWTTAAYCERNDPRIKAAVLMCPSLAMSDAGKLSKGHTSTVPALVMVGREDTVLVSKATRRPRTTLPNIRARRPTSRS